MKFYLKGEHLKHKVTMPYSDESTTSYVVHLGIRWYRVYEVLPRGVYHYIVVEGKPAALTTIGVRL